MSVLGSDARCPQGLDRFVHEIIRVVRQITVIRELVVSPRPTVRALRAVTRPVGHRIGDDGRGYGDKTSKKNDSEKAKMASKTVQERNTPRFSVTARL